MSESTPSVRALALSGVLVLAVISSQLLLPARAGGYSIALETDQQSYSGTQPIVTTGTVSPAPGAGTAVVVAITNSAGALADIAEVYPNASTGSFSYTSHPGGNSAWTSGTFTVNATWGGDSSTATQVVTFTYTAAEASTSSSTSTSSSSSARSSSSASSSTSTASSSSSSSVSAAKSTSSSSTTTSTTSTPEFPPSALAWVALAGAAFVAFASRRFPASTGRRALETP